MLNLNLFISTNGRIGRQTWWKSFIMLNAIIFFLYLFIFLFGNPTIKNGEDISGILQAVSMIIFQLIIAVVLIVVSIKRLHDIDKSGWYYLLALVPFIGAPILIIYLGFIKGTNGPNQYGEDPLLVD